MRTYRPLTNERGATLALVAVTMFLFLGVAALAIDLGMVKASGAQAQRAADAAALAGASALIDYSSSGASIIDSAAHARVLDYATRQSIRTSRIQASEVSDTVIEAESKVRVTVTRAALPTWFANTFGISSVSVSRTAAAVAADAGVSTNCVKPFLLPDRWAEADRVYQDTANFGVMDASTSAGEAWFYQPTQVSPSGGRDRYEAYDPGNPSSTQTGYGAGSSGLAGDRGLSMMLKPQTGKAQRMGNFYQILDPTAYGGASTVKDAIATGCMTASVGDTAKLKTGSTTSARQGMHELFLRSTDVGWDDAAGHPTPTATYPDWTQNPRVIIVAFYAPVPVVCDASKPNGCTTKSLTAPVTFQNFARIFIDHDIPATGPPINFTARFIGFLAGGGGGVTSGPTVKVLRLVE